MRLVGIYGGSISENIRNNVSLHLNAKPIWTYGQRPLDAAWQDFADAPMTLEEQLKNMSVSEWNNTRRFIDQTPYIQKDIMIWWHGFYAVNDPEKRIKVVRDILEQLCEVE